MARLDIRPASRFGFPGSTSDYRIMLIDAPERCRIDARGPEGCDVDTTAGIAGGFITRIRIPRGSGTA